MLIIIFWIDDNIEGEEGKNELLSERKTVRRIFLEVEKKKRKK